MNWKKIIIISLIVIAIGVAIFLVVWKMKKVKADKASTAVNDAAKAAVDSSKAAQDAIIAAANATTTTTPTTITTTATT